MYLVHYNPTTHKVLGYLDPTVGVYAEDDGTAYFSVGKDIHAQYSNADAWTDGKIITNIAPPNKFAQLTADGWVVDEQAQQKALEAAKQLAKASIDDAVSAIYQKFNRFEAEYAVREQQALEFKAAKYEGEVPHQIQAVVDPTGMTPQQATDSILAAANKLNTALDKFGELRMKKLAVDTMTEIDDVEAHQANVLAQIQAVASSL
ncbi:hypothetical protein VH441_07200 [Psychrobacter sp. HD31]|uniref:hypothetical protein n=1 Tax=Psychrobacter sp. HD31 TaxID=3112003 RepID=UPI003DA2AC2D